MRQLLVDSCLHIVGSESMDWGQENHNGCWLNHCRFSTNGHQLPITGLKQMADARECNLCQILSLEFDACSVRSGENGWTPGQTWMKCPFPDSCHWLADR